MSKITEMPELKDGMLVEFNTKHDRRKYAVSYPFAVVIGGAVQYFDEDCKYLGKDSITSSISKYYREYLYNAIIGIYKLEDHRLDTVINRIYHDKDRKSETVKEYVIWRREEEPKEEPKEVTMEELNKMLKDNGLPTVKIKE